MISRITIFYEPFSRLKWGYTASVRMDIKFALHILV